MKRLFEVISCIAALLCVSVLAQNSKVSKEGSRVTEAVADAGNVPATVVKHVLKNMYNNTCGASCSLSTLASGFTAVDSATTVSCPGTTGTCLIQADQWVQLAPASGDELAICLYVDGSDINGCYLNSSASTFDYVVDSMSQGITVSHGNHTVQTFVYDSSGGSLMSYYNVNYNVYKP
jgi:hypothetical protein